MLSKTDVIGLDKQDYPYNFSFLSKEFIVNKNFNRDIEPKIIFENDFFAVLYKPSAMPSAPLKKNDDNTLVNWFLQERPNSSLVKGRKEIEAGLINRLDTPTSGLVLIAKKQKAYYVLRNMQNENLIQKKYIAIVEIDKNKTSHKKLNCFKVPKKIRSQFRNFGPKGKKVMPVFSDDNRFIENGKNYMTNIINFEKTNDPNTFLVECLLKKGYRHQIRSHLSTFGLPIKNDALYNPNYILKSDEILEKHTYPLQLYAVGISFL